ncbi:MAG TPA: chemotaxis response regulator protein-glutamate methylesterase [Vicinamibacteria bacterium]|nr:chemotaxis response regulator protein-glutamate methylesterase [Vicinamibacteria bacterium]
MTNRTGGDEPRVINVLVVDDSAVVRQVLTAILTRTPGMSVTAAADPIIAQQKMKRIRPDVILLDIHMPRMDGLTFLRQVMAEDPVPVVVCSSLTGAGTEEALRALEEGAVDIVTKPKVGLQGFLEDSATRLTEVIRGAAMARLARRPATAESGRTAVPPAAPRAGTAATRTSAQKLIAVGASTGGTDAIREFLAAMPADAPPIVIVQHMPERFTRAFAERLDRTCALRVKEAVDGDPVVEGQALVAAGDRHLRVLGSGGLYVAEVRPGPLVSQHRPSVDVLFRSVAQAAGPHAVGVIMTGMGDDGAAGLLEMRQRGAATLAQDEATSIVFGMPREAVVRGAVGEVLPLDHLAAATLREARAGTTWPSPDAATE